jgi:hypothetical protein
MKVKLFIGIVVFILICLGSAFVAYMSGYNFDHRDADAGFWTWLTLFMAVCTSVMAASLYEEVK